MVPKKHTRSSGRLLAKNNVLYLMEILLNDAIIFYPTLQLRLKTIINSTHENLRLILNNPKVIDHFLTGCTPFTLKFFFYCFPLRNTEKILLFSRCVYKQPLAGLMNKNAFTVKKKSI